MTPQADNSRRADANGNPIYRVPDGNLTGLYARVEKLNRRAKRLGMEPLVLTETGEEFETRKRRATPVDEAHDITAFGHILGPERYAPRYIEYTLRFVILIVTGACPRINGWTFAATIAHDTDGNILRTAPGFDTLLPLEYRTASTNCDHCRTNRQRNDTYILRNDATGDWKQVGRNCLADFLRCENPAGLAEWAEVMASIGEEIGEFEDEDWGGGGHARRYINTLTLLAQVAACVRQDGWCSRTEARNSMVPKCASVDQALTCLDPKWQREHPDKAERYAVTEADEQKAAAAIAWAQELPADVANDYLWNLRVVSHKEAVEGRAAGLVGSVIVAHSKYLEAEIARKYERDHPSEYFGTVGERGIYTLTVVGRREIEGNYGCTTLVMFRDPAGNRAKWFASGDASGFELDATVTVKATIKAHEEYRGSKQTTLGRVAIWDEAADKAAKVARAAARKLIKARYTCPHSQEVNYGRVTYGGKQQEFYYLPAEIQNSNSELPEYIRCCPDCHAVWTARDGAQKSEAA